MNARWNGVQFSAFFVVLLVAWVADMPGDEQPVKTTVRASDGLNIVGEVRGQGDTALVLLHGWCGTREFWKHQVDALAGDYRIVAIDQAGHGESGKDRGAWTILGLAADVQAVVKELGLKRVVL